MKKHRAAKAPGPGMAWKMRSGRKLYVIRDAHERRWLTVDFKTGEVRAMSFDAARRGCAGLSVNDSRIARLDWFDLLWSLDRTELNAEALCDPES